MVYSLILSSFVLIIVIINIIKNKNIPVIALSLLLLYLFSFLIKIIDPTYYLELTNLINNNSNNGDISDFLFTYSFINFVIACIEFLICLIISSIKNKKRKRNVNSGLEAINTILAKIDFLDEEAIVIIDNNNFYLNKKFCSLYGFDSLIDYDNIVRMISSKDINRFKYIINNQNYRINNLSIKLIVNDKNIWFEESCINTLDSCYVILKRIKDENIVNDFVLNDFTAFSLMIDELRKSDIDFGIFSFHITSIYKDLNNIFQVESNEDIRMILSKKYINSIMRFLDDVTFDIFKIDINEYAVIIKNRKVFDFLLNKIKINKSTLDDFVYFLDEEKYLIKTKTVLIKTKKEEIIELLAKNMEQALLCDIPSIICIDNEFEIVNNDVKKDNEIKEVVNVNKINIKIEKDINY